MEDYEKRWCSLEGKKYRMDAYERQSRSGYKPLLTNPTFEEIKLTIAKYEPKTVLEIGCGWGRVLEELVNEPYIVTGCDVSHDMLELVPPFLRTFHMDIALPQQNLPTHDVLFSRGVLHYLLPSTTDMLKTAKKNMELMAQKKIILWEYPEVCDAVRGLGEIEKFEFRPIARNPE